MWDLWGLAAMWEGRDVSPGVGLFRHSALTVTLGTSEAHFPELSKVSSKKWGRADIFEVKKSGKLFFFSHRAQSLL